MVDIRDTFSVLVNQEEQSKVVEEVARTVVDPAKVITRSQPKMGSEDFADMLQAVPGAYFWVGHEGSVPVHNPGYVLDDKILPDRRQHVRAHHRNPSAGRPPMHKPASQEAVTPLHDLSAVDLIAGFRAKQFSPSEVLEDVLAHVAVWEPHIKALYAFDPDGARAVAKASTERWQNGEPIGALDGVPVTIKDNIATKGVPVPLGAATTKLVPAAGGCAAGGAAARSRRGDLLQDHDAGLRHAVVGPVELPSPHPQSLGSQQESRRLQLRRGRGGCGRLRPAASRHRYRRLGAAAGLLVRPRRAEAEPRADSDRSALCRPRRRTDDPHRR